MHHQSAAAEAGEPRQGVEVTQLEKQNERLRDALIKYRSILLPT